MPLEVALVAMPWPLADRPSIQIAALKSYLDQQLPGAVHVRAWHPYLAVAAALGLATYQRIAEQSWLAEAVYAPLVFPGQLPGAQQLLHRLCGRGRDRVDLNLPEVIDKIQLAHERSKLFDQLVTADLVGISVCLAQLTASLYLAREIKKKSPYTPIVMGGSAVCEAIGRSLLEVFPEIDYLVNGEGERPLTALIRTLIAGRRPDGVPGLYWRTAAGYITGGGRDQVKDLNGLPVPDYGGYFHELRNFPQLGNMIGQLPVESSRGCYWHRVRPGAPPRGCQFCNLNLQWRGYRSRSPRRVARELRFLARRHRVLRFFFVDNALNPASFEELFEEIGQLDCSLDLFAEIRAPLTRRQFQTMRLAGVKQVQVGIEALSSRLLAKMQKGTRAIDNVEMMKRCEEFGIRNLSNLLLEFPGSDREDVAATLATLNLVRCYQPLRVVRFWLGEGSPVHRLPQNFGLSAVRNHPWYRALFPDDLLARLCLMQKTYRGDRAEQHRLWQPVREQVKKWQQEYRQARQSHPDDPLLGYCDGGTFLVIRRRRASERHHEAYRLTGKSREVYLFCDTPRSFTAIQEHYPQMQPRQLLLFLQDLVTKGLMFAEGDEYLSLAVNEDIRRFAATASSHDDATKIACPSVYRQ